MLVAGSLPHRGITSRRISCASFGAAPLVGEVLGDKILGDGRERDGALARRRLRLPARLLLRVYALLDEREPFARDLARVG